MLFKTLISYPPFQGIRHLSHPHNINRSRVKYKVLRKAFSESSMVIFLLSISLTCLIYFYIIDYCLTLYTYLSAFLLPSETQITRLLDCLILSHSFRELGFVFFPSPTHFPLSISFWMISIDLSQIHWFFP